VCNCVFKIPGTSPLTYIRQLVSWSLIILNFTPKYFLYLLYSCYSFLANYVLALLENCYYMLLEPIFLNSVLVLFYQHAGSYELVPYYKGENTVFDVSPPSVSVNIKHQHVTVPQKFQVDYMDKMFNMLTLTTFCFLWHSEKY